MAQITELPPTSSTKLPLGISQTAGASPQQSIVPSASSAQVPWLAAAMARGASAGAPAPPAVDPPNAPALPAPPPAPPAEAPDTPPVATVGLEGFSGEPQANKLMTRPKSAKTAHRFPMAARYYVAEPADPSIRLPTRAKAAAMSVRQGAGLSRAHGRDHEWADGSPSATPEIEQPLSRRGQ